MDELKPCPFCGKEIELFSSHFEGQWCVHPPVIHCTACHQDYEGVGIAICDAMSDAKKEDFADNLLCNWWNHRPAEDALKAEVERLKNDLAIQKNLTNQACFESNRAYDEVEKWKKMFYDLFDKQASVSTDPKVIVVESHSAESEGKE